MVNYMAPHKPLPQPRFPHLETSCSSWLLDFLCWLVPHLCSSVLSAAVAYSKPFIKFVSYLLSCLECKRSLCLLFALFFCCWITLQYLVSRHQPGAESLMLSLNGAQYLTAQPVQFLQNMSAGGYPLLQYYKWIMLGSTCSLALQRPDENTLVMGARVLVEYLLLAPEPTPAKALVLWGQEPVLPCCSCMTPQTRSAKLLTYRVEIKYSHFSPTLHRALLVLWISICNLYSRAGRGMKRK